MWRGVVCHIDRKTPALLQAFVNTREEFAQGTHMGGCNVTYNKRTTQVSVPTLLVILTLEWHRVVTFLHSLVIALPTYEAWMKASGSPTDGILSPPARASRNITGTKERSPSPYSSGGRNTTVCRTPPVRPWHREDSHSLVNTDQ